MKPDNENGARGIIIVVAFAIGLTIGLLYPRGIWIEWTCGGAAMKYKAYTPMTLDCK